MAEIPLYEQILCARRELALRKKVYGKWVESRKMTMEKASHEIAAMEAIIQTLEQIHTPDWRIQW